MRGRATWTPDLIDEVRRHAKAGLTDQAIADTMGIQRAAICGARWRFNIPTDYKPRSPKPVPADFADIGPTLSVTDASAHYGVSRQTIDSWHQRTGTTPAVHIRPKKARAPQKASPPKVVKLRVVKQAAKSRIWHHPGKAPIAMPSRRDPGILGDAVLILQRIGPVFMARTIDSSAPQGQWIVSGRRVDEPELIRLAQRHGLKAA